MPLLSSVKRFRERHTTLIRGTALVSAFLFSFGTGLGYASWATVCRGGRCPTADALEGYQPRQTSKLFDVNGRYITELGLERRTLVKIADIPKVVREAFLETEDRRFYDHAGVDWRAVPRALIADIKARSWAEGFSTISMQLARNIFPERLSRDKSPVRKLKEIKVARAIEDRYPKDQILELYLNQIYFGNGAYGVETAAQRYFGKSIRDVNLVEAATLAAIPKSPTRYNPTRYPEEVVRRRNQILEVLRLAGRISDADASVAKAYPLRLAPRTETGEIAPYFVEHIRQQLNEKFGNQLYEQGLNVYTTLDIDMQAAAERVLERQITAIENGRFGAYKWPSYEQYSRGKVKVADPQNSPYLQGAFIAMDTRTGGVRALVGGRDFDDNQFNRATQALRQPGSTFKPIVYADAIQRGRPLSYLLDDSPLDVPMGDGSTWRPQNFEGRFEGQVPMRRALYRSVNVAAIRLGLELGTQSVTDMARRFGLTTEIPPYPSIFIGAAEVYPIELVAAYSAFANLGDRAVPRAIVRVESAKGEVLWQPEPSLLPVMSQNEAWLMVSAMRDVVIKGTAAGSVGSQIRFPAAGKTGTTNDGSDVWFVGYTSDLVAGVWIGFDRPKKIKANAQGGSLAGPAWAGFMNDVYRRRRAPAGWTMPLNIVERDVDVSTNMLASQYCPLTVVTREYFIPGTDPIYPCDVHTAHMPDTLGIGTYPPGTYPPGTYPPGTYPPGTVPPVRDTTRPDSTRPPIPPRTVFQRRDSLGRLLDSLGRRTDTIARRPPDTTVRPPVRPPDTTVRPPVRPPDTTVRPPVRPPDTTARPPVRPPDTTSTLRRSR
jgi:penicillin-binding protein 1A